MRILFWVLIIRTATTLTVRIGGVASASDVSPSESSSQRLWTFLVPGMTPQEAKESEGIRGLSQSERACGELKGWFLRLGLLGRWDDMIRFLINRRGFFGRERVGMDLQEEEEEEKRKRKDRAVKKKSGRDEDL